MERGRRNLEESIYNENHWPQLLHVSDVKCQIDCFACFAAYFSSFPKGNAFRSLEEHLWTINRKTEFPYFSLTLTISKIFPDFLKNSLTFPTTLKNFHFFCWLFRDNGNRDDKDGKVSTVCEPVHEYEYSTAFVSRAENYWIIWLSISQVGL